MNKNLKRTTKFVRVMMGVGLLCGFLGVQNENAQATEFETYPGIMCQPYTPVAGDNLYYDSQMVQNFSKSNSVHVTCPIRIPHPQKKQFVQMVSVDVKHNSDSENIRCQMAFRGSHGKLLGTKIANSELWGIILSPLVYEGVPQYGALFCLLPKKGSGINSYTVVTQDAE